MILIIVALHICNLQIGFEDGCFDSHESYGLGRAKEAMDSKPIALTGVRKAWAERDYSIRGCVWGRK